MRLHDLLLRQPFLPFIRQSEYAIRPPWHFPERRLLDYLLVYVQEGHCRFDIDGQAYDLYAGDFIFAQPNSVKTMRGLTPTVTPFAHMDLFYHPARAESFPTRAGQTDLRDYMHLMQPRLNDMEGIHIPVRLAPKEPERLAALMLRLVEAWREPDPLRQMEAQALASQLIVTILQDHTDLALPQANHVPAFTWLPSYLSLHLAEPIAVEDMARRANLSVSRFRDVCKDRFGMPPHQYLLHLRIDHAKELLRHSDYSVERIAQYCGFADIHHFSKTFKRVTLHTPSAYRRNS